MRTCTPTPFTVKPEDTGGKVLQAWRERGRERESGGEGRGRGAGETKRGGGRGGEKQVPREDLG